MEDDRDLSGLIALAGEKRGYAPKTAGDGAGGRKLVEGGFVPDLVILDINMPGMDGFGFCRWFREEQGLIPVIFLSARTEEYDKILALEIGGDDYLTKPFSMKELYARVAVCLRRRDSYGIIRGKPDGIPLEKDGIILDRESWTGTYKGRELLLTVTEFRLLCKFLESPGRVFSRDELARAAFPEDKYYGGRGIDVHITRIRGKLKKIDPRFSSLTAVYQVGYKWQI